MACGCGLVLEGLIVRSKKAYGVWIEPAQFEEYKRRAAAIGDESGSDSDFIYHAVMAYAGQERGFVKKLKGHWTSRRLEQHNSQLVQQIEGLKKALEQGGVEKAQLLKQVAENEQLLKRAQALLSTAQARSSALKQCLSAAQESLKRAENDKSKALEQLRAPRGRAAWEAFFAQHPDWEVSMRALLEPDIEAYVREQAQKKCAACPFKPRAPRVGTAAKPPRRAVVRHGKR